MASQMVELGRIAARNAMAPVGADMAALTNRKFLGRKRLLKLRKKTQTTGVSFANGLLQTTIKHRQVILGMEIKAVMR